MRELEPLASEAFSRLTGTDDGLRLVYEPSFEGELGEALERHATDDLRRAVTTVGPHRDDVAITSAGLDARTRLSQGRQRCVTLALRLASHQAVTAASGTPPVLLLDDAFSELDERTNQALFAELPDGQAILTTAGPLPRDAKPAALVEMAFGVDSVTPGTGSGHPPDPRPFGRSLDAYLASEGLGAMRTLAEVQRLWPEVVGEEVAAHCVPRSLEGSELVVAVDHPSRVTELAFSAATICQRLSDQLGYRAVERVKGRVDGRFGIE